MKAIKALFIVALFALTSQVNAQCDTEVSHCGKNMSTEYISDGQVYQAFLDGDQVAQFDVTLYGGSTYRISACSGDSEGNLIFRLIDQEGNELYSNEAFSNAPYWDFVIDSTISVSIEAQLDSNKKDSGCGVLLIGFKK